MNHDILKFRTIAVATDLSDPASAALRYAQTMARMHPSRLVLVHVIDRLRLFFFFFFFFWRQTRLRLRSLRR